MNSKAPLESGLVKGVGFAARRFNRIKDDRSRPRQCFVFQSPLFCHGVYNHERVMLLSLALSLFFVLFASWTICIKGEGEGKGERGVCGKGRCHFMMILWCFISVRRP